MRWAMLLALVGVLMGCDDGGSANGQPCGGDAGGCPSGYECTHLWHDELGPGDHARACRALEELPSTTCEYGAACPGGLTCNYDLPADNIFVEEPREDGVYYCWITGVQGSACLVDGQCGAGMICNGATESCQVPAVSLTICLEDADCASGSSCECDGSSCFQKRCTKR